MTVTPIFSFPVDGMQTASARFNASAQAISQGEIEPAQAVELVQSQRAFEANAAVAKAEDKTQEALLDALA